MNARNAKPFLAQHGWAEATQVPVTGDASNRRYTRLTNAEGQTAILMDAPPERGETVAPFVRMTHFLRDQGLSAPQIYAEDLGRGFLLIEDLGDDLFARLTVRDPSLQHPLYTAAVDVLLSLHRAPLLDLPLCDAQWLTDATDLVFDWYATEPSGKAAFRDTFRPLAEKLDTFPKVVILRDYHAENLLWLPDRAGVAKVGLLDFQDALQGHPAYDLVSVLQDARRDVDPGVEAEMLAHYLAMTDHDPTGFRAAYALLGVQRNLRIIGIFARLCLRDGKAHYIDMIPRVWGYVKRNLLDKTLGDIAEVIHNTLPPPNEDHLQELRRQCARIPGP